jgi:hypothetical protein
MALIRHGGYGMVAFSSVMLDLRDYSTGLCLRTDVESSHRRSIPEITVGEGNQPTQ